MDETRPRTNRHTGLEPAEVLDRAIALVQVEGADALTMRRLASELGVATTSIYWHVGNREELVAAMVRRHGERLAEAPIVGDTARQRVLAVARLIWEGALADRGITRLASAHGLSSLHAQRLELAMARELQEAGVVGDTARDALRAITACVGGFIVAALLDDPARFPTPCVAVVSGGTWIFDFASPRPAAAHFLRVVVEVDPDYFYRSFFANFAEPQNLDLARQKAKFLW